MSVKVVLHTSVPCLHVAGDVEIEVIALDLIPRGKTGIVRNLHLPTPCIDDATDVLFAEAVLRPVLHEALLGVDKEHALALLCAALVNQDD